MPKRKWEITTLEPAVDMNQDGVKVSYYRIDTVEADAIDVHEGILTFLNINSGQDEARFPVMKKELVAGYTIANIISFKEVPNEQTSETTV